MEEIKQKLVHNYIVELGKKEIDKFERAKLIREYCKEHDLTFRKFGERFGFAKSTLDNWIIWTNITAEEEQELIKKGLTATEIRNLMLKNRHTSTNEYAEIDLILDKTITCLNSHKKVSEYTPEKLDLLQKAINTFKFHNKL